MNGMCIALRNGARTETVFIEQDVLELENLNRQTAARRRAFLRRARRRAGDTYRTRLAGCAPCSIFLSPFPCPVF